MRTWYSCISRQVFLAQGIAESEVPSGSARLLHIHQKLSHFRVQGLLSANPVMRHFQATIPGLFPLLLNFSTSLFPLLSLKSTFKNVQFCQNSFFPEDLAFFVGVPGENISLCRILNFKQYFYCGFSHIQVILNLNIPLVKVEEYKITCCSCKRSLYLHWI